MLNKVLFFILAVFLIDRSIVSGQMELEWEIVVGSGIAYGIGLESSPLFLDVYPQYYGQEVYMPSTVLINGNPYSRVYALRANTGDNAFPGGPLDRTGIARSSATGALFENSDFPKIVFANSNGVYFISYDRVDYWQMIGAGVSSTPVLANLDYDNWLEIVVADDSGMLYAWNLDGNLPEDLVGFPVNLQGNINLTSPAVANVNTGDLPEIVVTTENQIHVIDQSGQYLNGWPLFFSSGISTSAAIGKLDNFDDDTRNIVYATDDGVLYISRFNGGLIVPPIYLGASTDTSPILADIYQDEKPEVIICTSDSRVHAYQANGNSVPGWPVDLSDYTTSLIRNRDDIRVNWLFADPLVADIDGDGMLEVIVPIVEEATLVSLSTTGEIETGWPIALGVDDGGSFKASPAIGDIDYDGQLELVAGLFGSVEYAPRIKSYQLGPVSGIDNPWPVYRQNFHRTAALPEPGETGFPPTCDFPARFIFAPTEQLEIDFSQHVYDPDSPSNTWNCSISGLQNLIVNQGNNNWTFLITSNNWTGYEIATCTMTDPDNQSCSNDVLIFCGLKGDVDSNGQITTTDILILLSIILGAEPTLYQAWAANVNDDLFINIQDLIEIIDIME